ncbi:MAG: GSCFA domain-containing protein [Candidatus Symbiothrix sp.]|jgi:hypothetical protein|nr:GSCFA domain-containing protein [Candidatus Symbiothrix sp.]
MKFRTEITVPSPGFHISHTDKILLTGSCFVSTISTRMQESGFTVDVNPFGIVYNPASLANGLTDLINNKTYTEENLFLHQGLYHSFSHHSRFSGTSIETVLQKINASISHSSGFLRQANLLIITFGTANTYRLVSSGEVVSNCHKLPAQSFIEERLTISQITGRWNILIKELQALNPDLKILFTVSPIRHWKDGANANQLNKAILLLAVNELTDTHPQCYYFPSYEIMLDDLRDYRFYAADLIHPNAQAIDYIWEKFGEAYFDKKTMELNKEYEKKQKALNHRPLH